VIFVRHGIRFDDERKSISSFSSKDISDDDDDDERCRRFVMIEKISIMGLLLKHTMQVYHFSRITNSLLFPMKSYLFNDFFVKNHADLHKK
jgi:hypothetical protein